MKTTIRACTICSKMKTVRNGLQSRSKTSIDECSIFLTLLVRFEQFLFLNSFYFRTVFVPGGLVGCRRGQTDVKNQVNFLHVSRSAEENPHLNGLKISSRGGRGEGGRCRKRSQKETNIGFSVTLHEGGEVGCNGNIEGLIGAFSATRCLNKKSPKFSKSGTKMAMAF